MKMTDYDCGIAIVIMALVVALALNIENITPGFLLIFHICLAAVAAFIILRHYKIIIVESQQI
jgi:hypothetical protein